ncbi:MAG: hypothetical protein ACO1RT_02295 [Planctomycetaceae bacterium]
MDDHSPLPTSHGNHPYSAHMPPAGSLEPGQHRPSGLTATGVLCIVGGVVGILSGLLTLLNALLSDVMASAFSMPGPDQAAQQQFYDQLQAVADRYFIATLVTSSATFLIGLGLLAGGVGIFSSPPWGRILIRRVLVAAMVIEIVKAIVYSLSQFDMMPIMESHMQQMADKAGGGAMPMGEMMRVMTWIGISIWLVWAMLKFGLYLAGRHYLKRPHVIAYFAGKAS